jgi:hypothetical protein
MHVATILNLIEDTLALYAFLRRAAVFICTVLRGVTTILIGDFCELALEILTTVGGTNRTILTDSACFPAAIATALLAFTAGIAARPLLADSTTADTARVSATVRATLLTFALRNADAGTARTRVGERSADSTEK